MNNFIKKIFAVLMAILILMSTLSASFITFADDIQYPYVDENGIYWTSYANVQTAYNTDYDEMVLYFRRQFLNRADEINYYFATTDTKYAYSYIYNGDATQAKAAADLLYNDLCNDIFTTNTDNPQLGDYLFNSVHVSSYGSNYSLSAANNPVGNNPRYYTFSITMENISYNTTVEEEKQIAEFAREFSNNYLADCDTDYKKVKTIYDFIVRNSTYDYDVFSGKYEKNEKRYNIAHSAYGAICGSLIAEGKSFNDYDMTPKDSIVSQKIIGNADQGLAVCEGYSKLFCYLCTYNSIKCRIVDGDYIAESKKSSDPHEWNYVYLDDGCGDGYKWFQVDTTFASQKSYKQIDVNCYDYFLCGTSNINFGYMNHQQPYEFDESNNSEYRQLYDWYTAENMSSYEDYQIPLVNLDAALSSENDTVIIRRSTDYNNGEGEKYAFIVTDLVNSYRIELDEDGYIDYKNVEGFSYNNNDASFTVIIPYLIDREYNVEDIGFQKECGSYNIHITGKEGTSYDTRFSIVPLDMSNDEAGNYIDIDVQTSAGYTGETMTPHTFVIDKYNNKLEEGVDFDVFIYSDSEHTTPAEIKEIGQYYLDVAYKGNYSGHYYLTFSVDKIRLEQINSENYEFDYLPQYFRTYNGVTDATSYFVKAGANLKIGDITINPDIDFSLKADGGLEYGDKGTITLTGLEGSEKVEAGTKLKLTYEISGRFDITQNFNGSVADSNTENVYYYTGSAIKPTSFDYLDERLVQGTDYKIVSYSNNVNAGKAGVTVQGINGCTGTATMIFLINPASISSAQLSTSNSNGNITCSLTYNGKKLVKGVDYTETNTTTDTGYTITIKGIGNFSGSRVVNVVTGSYVKPTSSGNYITLSASSYTYDGKAKKPSVKLYNKNKELINPYYYTVAYASGRTNAGTYKITVNFRNGYSGTLTKTFKINAKALSGSNSTVTLSAASYTYDGKVKIPSVTVKYGSKKLVKGTDYTVSYASGRKNVGKYNVKITFKGNYSGTITKSFTIKPKNTSISSVTAKSKGFTVKWKKYTTQTTGYQIQYSTSSKFTNAKTVTVSKNSTTSKTISKLSAKKKYYVRIRTYKTVSGTKYYSSWSSAKSITTK